MLQRYYNDCKNMIERNEGRVLIDQYRQGGAWVYLRTHSDKIWMIEIINQLPDFHINNTDLLDALVSCELYDRDEYKKSNRKVSVKYKEVSYITTDESGRRVTKWQKIPIFENGGELSDKNSVNTWNTRTPKEEV